MGHGVLHQHHNYARHFQRSLGQVMDFNCLTHFQFGLGKTVTFWPITPTHSTPSFTCWTFC
jgi:hypothetical protein